jgi:hypothetical protein
MKTAFIRIVDGIYTDQYALGMIDFTHLYWKRYEGSERPSKAQIKQGWVYHVAQLKGMAEGLYEAVEEWLHDQRELENVGFAA